MEIPLPVAQIDFSQPITSTEEEGNRNEGNDEAFSSDQADIVVTEVEQIKPKTVKDAECQTMEFHYMFQTSRYQDPNKDFFKLTIKFAFTLGYRLTCYTANIVAQEISRVHYCTYET